MTAQQLAQECADKYQESWNAAYTHNGRPKRPFREYPVLSALIADAITRYAQEREDRIRQLEDPQLGAGQWKEIAQRLDIKIIDEQRDHNVTVDRLIAAKKCLQQWLKVADDCHQEQQEVGQSEYNITAGLLCDTRAILGCAALRAERSAP